MRAPLVPMSEEVARTEVAAWVEKVAALLPAEFAETWRSLPAHPSPWMDLKLRLAVLEPVLELLRTEGI